MTKRETTRTDKDRSGRNPLRRALRRKEVPEARAGLMQAFFAPKSIALYGASERHGSVGRAVANNILAGGFNGDITFINPKHRHVFGRPAFDSLGAAGTKPDLALVATPPATAASILHDIAKSGCRAAIIITAGFNRIKPGFEEETIALANKLGIRIIGPNVVGILLPGLKLNASFAHLQPHAGHLALVSQSGAILTTILDWAAPRGIGFSALLSIGNSVDIGMADLVDYLADDPQTEAILLYMEAIQDGRRFLSAARRAARKKPLIVIKVGRQPEGAKAVMSHTGALAGSDMVYEAAFHRAGLLRVKALEDLFNMAEILAGHEFRAPETLTIITNGGGAGVIAADRLSDLGGTLSTLSPDTIKKLDKVMPKGWSRANPVDIIGDADSERYRQAVSIVMDDPACDAVLVLRCPTSIATAEAVADAVIAALQPEDADTSPMLADEQPLVMTCWLGQETAEPGRKRFRMARAATFETPEDAVESYAAAASLAHEQARRARMPGLSERDVEADAPVARAILETAAGEGRSLLYESEAKQLLAAYGIPIVETLVAATPEETGEIARKLLKTTGACVIKVISPEITHKSDVGGVRLSIGSPEEAVEQARDMLLQVTALQPEAEITGIAVQPMIAMDDAYLLIAGLALDPVFGPVILFGAGGTAVEVIDDKALDLPPLDDLLADDLIERTRIARLLAGYRHRPPANRAAIRDVLIRLGRMTIDLPEITKLDINPLMADEHHVIALDARVVFDLSRGGQADPHDHLAIAPWPVGWQDHVDDRDNGHILIRPILPTDERLYPTYFAHMQARDLRYRLFNARRIFTHEDFAPWTQIDYARDMAFVAIDEAQDVLVGVARYARDGSYNGADDSHGDGASAEFAILVRSDRQNRNIGYSLMQRLIAHGRAHGLGWLHGQILADNTGMLALACKLGFELTATDDDPSIFLATLELNGAS